jgi:hypothetical protein
MYVLALRSRVAARVVSLATVVAVLLVASALGDEPPKFTSRPVLQGPPAVGAELRIAAAWRGAPAPAQLYEWDRCDASGLFCSVVPNACAASHVVTGADVGGRLRAQVSLFNAVGATMAATPFSGLVAAPPQAPPPQPAPPAKPAKPAKPPKPPKPPKGQQGDPGGGLPYGQGGSSGGGGGDALRPGGANTCAPVVPPVAPVPPAPPPAAPPPAAAPIVAASPVRSYLKPFPTVSIAGYTVAGGARITLLSVHGAPSAVVRATCVGAGCPRRKPSPVHPPARLRTLEHFYRAGTVLQIRVTAGGPTIGKYTSFRILAHHQPRRVDRCLMSSRSAPVRCPPP